MLLMMNEGYRAVNALLRWLLLLYACKVGRNRTFNDKVVMRILPCADVLCRCC